MNTLKIGTYGEQTAFQPGATIAGRVLWILEEAQEVEAVELRLFWYTEGKGTRDVSLVQWLRFDQPQRREQREFSFVAPASPHSFSGKLISLIWALELVVLPSEEAERLLLTIGPGAAEVRLEGGSDELELTEADAIS
jgi:hypothetical protein